LPLRRSRPALHVADPVAQTSPAVPAIPGPIINFDGVAGTGLFLPPDTNGDIGDFSGPLFPFDLIGRNDIRLEAFVLVPLLVDPPRERAALATPAALDGHGNQIVVAEQPRQSVGRDVVAVKVAEFELFASALEPDAIPLAIDRLERGVVRDVAELEREAPGPGHALADLRRLDDLGLAQELFDLVGRQVRLVRSDGRRGGHQNGHGE
jgi:hypothetical protein